MLLAHFRNFVNFQLKKAEFSLKFDKNSHRMTPYFGKFTPKKGQIFLNPTPNDPFFMKCYTYSNAPCFCSPVGTLSDKLDDVLFWLSTILWRWNFCLDTNGPLSQFDAVSEDIKFPAFCWTPALRAWRACVQIINLYKRHTENCTQE